MTPKAGTFDAAAFYDALDAVRAAKGLSWRDVAVGAGLSPSTLTRMAQQKRPDVDSLAALCAWSGLRADSFMRVEGSRHRVEPLAAISTLLRSDRNLSRESAARLSEIIKVSYHQLRDS